VRIVKILRLSRLARLMRAVPEIIILLKGIGAAARSVFSLFALWLIIIYVFAVFFVQTTPDSMEKFDSVPRGMNTLLLEGILPDNSMLVEDMSDANAIFWPIIMSFVLLASITLSYMLIGVLVQIVHVIAESEREKAMVESVASHLRVQWHESYNMDAILHKQKFQRLLLQPGVAMFLTEVGVDMLALMDLSEMIYEDLVKEQGGVNFENFVNIVLNMRGQNPSTVQDESKLIRFMKRVITEQNAALQEIMMKKFTKCSQQINRVRKVVLGEVDTDEEISNASGGEETTMIQAIGDYEGESDDEKKEEQTVA